MYLVTCPHSCNKACAVLQHTPEHSHPTLLFHTGLPKSGDMDSDDDTLHPPKRKRLRVLEDDLVCSEVYSNTSTCTTASTCTAASTCTTAYQADTESKDSKEYILVGVPKSIKKTKEESTPLPDPFPLPTNFRPDVHLCLVKKKMTKASRAAFYTAVAAAMFQYKRYPSRDDFVSVARQIIAKYPFLGSKSFGASHVRSLLVFSMHALPFLMVASHSFPSPTYNYSCRCSMNLKGPHI